MTPQIEAHPDKNLAQRYTRWVIRHRWWILSLSLAGTQVSDLTRGHPESSVSRS